MSFKMTSSSVKILASAALKTPSRPPPNKTPKNTYNCPNCERIFCVTWPAGLTQKLRTEGEAKTAEENGIFTKFEMGCKRASNQR